MANLSELAELHDQALGGDLIKRVQSAVIIAANSIANPTAIEKAWIKNVLMDARSEAMRALKILLAKRNTQPVSYFSDTTNGLTDAILVSDVTSSLGLLT